MSVLQKTPLNAVRKNLTCLSEKTFRSRRFSQGNHWERVWMMRESSITRRECDGKVSPVCCSSLRFECALDFEGVGVTSSRQVFPHLSLRRQLSFLWDTHQWFFKFLVIFIARVISSVYCSMSWIPVKVANKIPKKQNTSNSGWGCCCRYFLRLGDNCRTPPKAATDVIMATNCSCFLRSQLKFTMVDRYISD
jgi:hypothetical protein